MSAPTPRSTSAPTHRDDVALDISAVTMVFAYTRVLIEQVARSTDTALPAGVVGFVAGVLTVAIRVGAGTWTGREAVGAEAVDGALHSYGVEGERGSRHASAPPVRSWPCPSLPTVLLLETQLWLPSSFSSHWVPEGHLKRWH